MAKSKTSFSLSETMEFTVNVARILDETIVDINSGAERTPFTRTPTLKPMFVPETLCGMIEKLTEYVPAELIVMLLLPNITFSLANTSGSGTVKLMPSRI